MSRKDCCRGQTLISFASFNCLGDVRVPTAGELDDFACSVSSLTSASGISEAFNASHSHTQFPAESGGTHDSCISCVLLPICARASYLVE